MTTTTTAQAPVTPEQDWSDYRPNQYQFPMTLKGVKAEDDRGREQRIVHVVHNDVLKAGDVVPSHIYIKQTFVVKEIKSSRPASGSWKCPRPTWYEVVIE